MTDLEFYELRYSGKLAAFLHGFRAIYLGILLNVLVTASVTLATIKIGSAMLGLTPAQSMVGILILTGIFSAAGGLQGVLMSDFVLFIVAMAGSIGAAYFAVKQPEVGGLQGMIEKLSAMPEHNWKLSMLRFQSPSDFIAAFIIPITVVWWAVWYTGAEPGGGGFTVQRMLAAKNEKHAVGATLLFQVTHYALRPWPWFIVALCSLLVFPDRQALIAAVGDALPESQIQSDVAYPLMMTKLPPVWAGIVVASLVAAYVSTLSTMLNWGASYFVQDVYVRFLRPKAQQRELVNVARLTTIGILFLATILSFFLRSSADNLNILLAFGAGTGLLYMLRWFWWRINAAAELTAMLAAAFFAVYFKVFHKMIFPEVELSANTSLLLTVIATTFTWLIPVFVCRPTAKEKLYSFIKTINPPGPGWDAIRKAAAAENVNLESKHKTAPLGACLGAAFFSCLFIYGILLALGDYLYGKPLTATAYLVVSIISGWMNYKLWRKSEEQAH